VASGTDVALVLVRSGEVLTVYPAAMTLPDTVARLRALPTPPALEVRDAEELPERPGLSAIRRVRLDVILGAIPTLHVDAAAADAYAGIVAPIG
jgi:antitoxin VapB